METYPFLSEWAMSASKSNPQHHRIHSLDGNSPRRNLVDPLSRGYVTDDIPPTSPTDHRDSIINRLKTSETSNMATNHPRPFFVTSHSQLDRKFKSKTPDPFVSRDAKERHHQSSFDTTNHRKMSSEDRRYDYFENSEANMSDPSSSISGRNKVRRPQPIYMRENEDIDDLDKAGPDSTLIAWSSAQTAQMPLEEVIKKTAQIQMHHTPTLTSTDSEVTETGSSGLPKTPDSGMQHIRTPIFAYSSGTSNDTESVGSVNRHQSPRLKAKSHIAFV